MFGKIRSTRLIAGALLMALLECAGLAAVEVAISTPAQAQFWNDWTSPRRPSRPRSGGFFQNLFGQPETAPYPDHRSVEPRHQAPVDSARAPAPRKPDPKAEPVTPTTTIVVMGDGMADWLAYGLEDAFADTPEVAIVRKNKLHSGLLRYDPKDDLDWWHVARDILAQEKASYVVMMLGVSDRQNIRERDLAKEAEKNAKDEQAKTSDAAAKSDQPASADKQDAADAKTKKTNGVVEFQSDQWERIYTRRIDDTIAALKSKGVPVFWVGLPAIRGTRSTAETSYLNNLYRQRAERAGIVYIDVWDGFVDDAGKYTSFGPDYEGQNRRLRSADGVYFTRYGARKVAHYVEREIRRYMSNRIVALPAAPVAPAPDSGKPAERPLAGPVVPLTVTTSASEELIGGGAGGRVHGDAIAAQVLVKGEPLPPRPGRADDFAWPPGSEPRPQPAAAAEPAVPAQPAAVQQALPAAVEQPQSAPQTNATPGTAAPEPAAAQSKASVEPAAPAAKPVAKPAQRAAAKPHEAEAPRRADRAVPRPPRDVPRAAGNDPLGRGGLFGIFR